MELDSEGFAQTFGDGQSVYDLSEVEGIYALQIPPTRATANRNAATSSDRTASTNGAPAADDKREDKSLSVNSNSHSIEQSSTAVSQAAEATQPIKGDAFESQIPIGEEGSSEPEGKGKEVWEDREIVLVVLNKLIRSTDEGAR